VCFILFKKYDQFYCHYWVIIIISARKSYLSVVVVVLYSYLLKLLNSVSAVYISFEVEYETSWEMKIYQRSKMFISLKSLSGIVARITACHIIIHMGKC